METTIKAYCNRHLYSDIRPFEVLRVINDKTIEVREMNAKLITPAKQLGIGGFAANFDNSTQRWKCESNLEASTMRIHLGKKGWGHGQFRMDDEPVKFYDYNY